jgi:hypothetical protein
VAVDGALRQYRRDSEPLALIHAVGGELAPPSRQHLLAAFRPFVPRDRQAALAQRVADARAGPQGAAATASAAGLAAAQRPAAAAAVRRPAVVGAAAAAVAAAAAAAGVGTLPDRSARPAPPGRDGREQLLARQQPRGAPQAPQRQPQHGWPEDRPRPAAAAVAAAPPAPKPLPPPAPKHSGPPGKPCPTCSKPQMESPHEATCCGRQACYSCWLRAVALHKCPGCGKLLRKSMLRKQFFS